MLRSELKLTLLAAVVLLLTASERSLSNQTLSSEPPSAVAISVLQGYDKPVRWGGEGIVLTSGKTWASIDFGCARASASGGLRPGKNGYFNVAGSYNPGSAIRSTEAVKSIPIRIEGKISKKKMTLKITDLESGKVLGNYTLERNKAVQLSRCL